MATITLDTAVYNKAQAYADEKNISVDELVVSLINKLTPKRKGKYRMKPIEELSPLLQQIAAMPRTGGLEDDDVNCNQARLEHYKEKYDL
ncbi:MAG: hypothetical protein IJ527_04035 [Prevotella sp.]|nr:hypothetical protein [Prevotella sp.]